MLFVDRDSDYVACTSRGRVELVKYSNLQECGVSFISNVSSILYIIVYTVFKEMHLDVDCDDLHFNTFREKFNLPPYVAQVSKEHPVAFHSFLCESRPYIICFIFQSLLLSLSDCFGPAIQPI